MKTGEPKLIKKCTSILFFYLLFFYPIFSYGDSTDWILRKNDNGIAVYTRHAENSDLKEVRVLNTVESSLSAIVALLLDVKNYPNWIYACSEASVLNEISNQEHYQYEVTDAPWPVSDRDVISHFKIVQDATTKL